MTREEAMKEVNKAFEPAFANLSRTEVIDAIELVKAKYNVDDIEDSIER